MNKSNLDNKSIKEMVIDKIYLYYDQPVLFQSSINNQKYIGYLLSDNNDIEKWIFFHASDLIFQKMSSNDLSLLKALNHPTIDLYECNIFKDGEYEVYPSSLKNLDIESLPDKQLFIGKL